MWWGWLFALIKDEDVMVFLITKSIDEANEMLRQTMVSGYSLGSQGLGSCLK